MEENKNKDIVAKWVIMDDNKTNCTTSFKSIAFSANNSPFLTFYLFVAMWCHVAPCKEDDIGDGSESDREFPENSKSFRMKHKVFRGL